LLNWKQKDFLTDYLISLIKNGEQAMINHTIEQYLERHYRQYLDKQHKMKVTHLVDKGHYYQFHLWKDDVLFIGETVWKNDLERGRK